MKQNHELKCVTEIGAPDARRQRVAGVVDQRRRPQVQPALQFGPFRLEVLEHGLRRGERERVAHEGAGEEGHADVGIEIVAVLPMRRRRARP